MTVDSTSYGKSAASFINSKYSSSMIGLSGICWTLFLIVTSFGFSFTRKSPLPPSHLFFTSLLHFTSSLLDPWGQASVPVTTDACQFVNPTSRVVYRVVDFARNQLIRMIAIGSAWINFVIAVTFCFDDYYPWDTLGCSLDDVVSVARVIMFNRLIMLRVLRVFIVAMCLFRVYSFVVELSLIFFAPIIMLISQVDLRKYFVFLLVWWLYCWFLVTDMDRIKSRCLFCHSR